MWRPCIVPLEPHIRLGSLKGLECSLHVLRVGDGRLPLRPQEGGGRHMSAKNGLQAASSTHPGLESGGRPPGPHRRVARRPANEGTQGTSQSWEVHASNRPKEFALSGRYSKVPLAVQHGTGDTCRVWHRKDFFNNAAKLKHIKKLKRAPEAELAHTCRAFSSCAAMLSAGCGLWRASSRRSTAGKKPRPWRQGAEKRHVLCSYCAAMRCVLLCFSSYTLPFEGLVSLYSYLLTARWRTSSCRC